MDPLTAAGTFTTIIGLVCNYRQEKGDQETLDHQKFIEWLEYHRHEEIKNLICTTNGLLPEIDKLLRADHAVVMEKLGAINTTLATLTSHVAEFRGLTLNLVTGTELSDQAISILRQFVKSNAEYFFKHEWDGKFALRLWKSGHIDYQEPRFVDDDLDKLVSAGLLAEDYGTSGRKIYKITRSSFRFIETIDWKQK